MMTLQVDDAIKEVLSKEKELRGSAASVGSAASSQSNPEVLVCC